MGKQEQDGARAGPALAAAAALLLALALPGCTTRTSHDGRSESRFDPRAIAKTDIDRVIDASQREVSAGLKRLTEKLYRRNPREWKKVGQPSLEAAVARIFDNNQWPELEGRREAQAMLLAFREDYHGDRVLALMAGVNGMVQAAYEHKTDFYVLDGLDAQKLYNCARNLEIVAWRLNNNRNVEGELYILSNEPDAAVRNLSFEREIGRLVGLLDFLSVVVADKNGRTINRVMQNLATAVFLPVAALTPIK